MKVAGNNAQGKALKSRSHATASHILRVFAVFAISSYMVVPGISISKYVQAASLKKNSDIQ